jgi:hypothetical protein
MLNIGAQGPYMEIYREGVGWEAGWQYKNLPELQRWADFVKTCSLGSTSTALTLVDGSSGAWRVRVQGCI